MVTTDLPPPLEDFSRVLNRTKANAPSVTTAVINGSTTPIHSNPCEAPITPPKPAIQRGFLARKRPSKSSQLTTPSPTVSSVDIPTADVIHLNPSSSPTSCFRFPEVQTAVRGLLEAEKKSWLTPALMERVSRDPVLSRAVVSQKFSEALQLMQKSPEVAKTKYSKDKEITEALKRYMEVMGEHFSHLAETQQSAEVGGALSDPLVQQTLQDPTVLKLLEALKGGARIDPRRLPHEVLEKVKLLVDKKLISLGEI